MVRLQRAQMRRHDLAEAALLVFPAHDEHERARRHGCRERAAERKSFQQAPAARGTGTRRRQRFLDSAAQADRRFKMERGRGHRLMHLPGVTQLCGAMWANLSMSFDFARVSSIE